MLNPMDLSSLESKDLPIVGKGSSYLSLGTLAAIVLWLLASVFWVTKTFLADPVGSRNTDLTFENDSLKKQNTNLVVTQESLEKRLAGLHSRLEAITNKKSVPSVVSPSSDQIITGRNVKFRWVDSPSNKTDNMLVEVSEVASGRLTGREYRVLEPKLQFMILNFEAKTTGHFLWRVGYGLGDSVPDEWSDYGSFFIYPDLLTKLKLTEKIVAGLGLPYPRYDEPITKLGQPASLDLDVLIWVVDELRSRLKVPDLELVIQNAPWRSLLSSVHSGEFDIGLFNIARSKRKENKYPGVKFTAGYVENEEILIYNNKSSKIDWVNIKDIDSLKEQAADFTLGAQHATINLQAAEFLAHNNWEFKITPYLSLFDVFSALRTGKVDVAMVNSVNFAATDEQDFSKVTVSLEKVLSDFYTEELGVKRGEYSIAIAPGDSEGGLRDVINEILTSKSGIAKLKEIREKYLKDMEIKPGSTEALNSTKPS